jgi:hypothetical protein
MGETPMSHMMNIYPIVVQIIFHIFQGINIRHITLYIYISKDKKCIEKKNIYLFGLTKV